MRATFEHGQPQLGLGELCRDMAALERNSSISNGISERQPWQRRGMGTLLTENSSLSFRSFPSGVRLHEAFLDRLEDGAGAVPHTKLGEDVRNVVLHGSFRER